MYFRYFIICYKFYFFGCLEFIVPLKHFSLIWRRHHVDVTIAGERLQILTYARHSWPLNSEGSLTCHSYCDTGLPFIMVISEDPWHSHLLQSVWRWSCHCFFRLRSVATGDRTAISRMRGERSTSTPPRRSVTGFIEIAPGTLTCAISQSYLSQTSIHAIA